jgi:hypothetical protein
MICLAFKDDKRMGDGLPSLLRRRVHHVHLNRQARVHRPTLLTQFKHREPKSCRTHRLPKIFTLLPSEDGFRKPHAIELKAGRETIMHRFAAISRDADRPE